MNKRLRYSDVPSALEAREAMRDDGKEIKVYYNSACPVCNAGISRQKTKMRGYKVQWKDVHIEQNACQEIGAEREFVRERLHAIDERGRIRIGVEAFETIWRHNPDERWKAGLVSLPGIKQIATVIYNAFARLLYKWNRFNRRW